MNETNTAYFQLVLLSERPGARIGRVPADELTDTETTIATVLDLKAQLELRLRSGPLFLELAVELPPSWWTRGFAALERIGDKRVSRYLGSVLRLARVQAVDDREVRAAQTAALRTRRVETMERVAFEALLEMEKLHNLLFAWTCGRAADVPGFESLVPAGEGV